MRLLVCGGRNFGTSSMDICKLDEALDCFHGNTPISELIHGAARGADNMAAYWAVRNQIPCRAFPADWKKHGRAAGHIRNQQMLDEGQPNMVMAFPGGRGTANMISRAEKAGIPVQCVR